MPIAEVNGQRIAYDDTGGDGPPVVLAHGFLMDRTMFAPQVAALRDSYRVITWDERGWGETEYDQQPFTYWDSARDLLALMDHFGLERAVIGGMSQGGFLTLRAALLAPERVRGLILLDTQAGVDDQATLDAYRQMVDVWRSVGPIDELANTVASIIIDHPEENARWIAKWRSRPNESIVLPAACLFDRDDITDRVGEITAPALIVHGTGDTAIPMDRARQLAAGLAGPTTMVEVAGAHAACMTHPAPVNDAVRAFLDGLAD